MGLCTVFDCEKPSIYASFHLITVTLLRPCGSCPQSSIAFYDAVLFLCPRLECVFAVSIPGEGKEAAECQTFQAPPIKGTVAVT